MVKSSIEKLSEEIGYDIGMSDDQTQSNLLNGFASALSNSMQKQQFEYFTEIQRIRRTKIMECFAKFISNSVLLV